MFKYVLILALFVSSINCMSNNTFESLKIGISPFNNAGNNFFNLIRGDIDTSALKLEEFQNLTLSFESLKKITSVYLSHTILIATGITFAILLPIVGFFFCCCRCFGKCGGKIKSMDPRNVRCKKTFYGILLTVFTLGMIFSVIITLFNNQIVHESLISSNPSINFLMNAKSKMDQIKSSLVTMKEEIKKVESSQISNEQLVPFSKSVLKSFETFFTNFKKVSNVQDLITQSNEIMNSIVLLNQDNYQEVLRNINGLSDDLKDIKNIIMLKLSTCATQPDCESARKKTESLMIKVINESDRNSINNALNYFTGKDFNEGLDKIVTMKNISLEMKLQTDQEIKNIKDRINDKSFSESLKDFLIQQIDKLISVRNQINEYMPIPLKNETKQYEYYRTMKSVEQYRYYIYIGLSLCIVLIIIFYLLGLLYGNYGERPEEDAGCFNRGVGANFVMISITLTFLFSSLIMITVLTNISTTNVFQTDFCRFRRDDFKDLRDPKASELMDRYIQFVVRGVSTNQHAPDGIVESLFLDCDQKNFYQAFYKINHKYLIQKFQAPFNEIDIKLTNILISELNLRKYLDNDPFKVMSSIDLNKLSDSVYLFKDNEEQAYYNDMNKLTVNTSNEMKRIQNLNANIAKSKSVLKKIFDHLFLVHNNYIKWRELAQTFNDNRESLIRPWKKFDGNGGQCIVMLFLLISQFLSDLMKTLESNLLLVFDLLFGTMFTKVSCQQLSGGFKELLIEICENFIDPFNGCWYGLGFFLLLVIPALICACKLVGLYRRIQKFYPDKEEPDYENYLGFYARVDNEAMKNNASQSKAPHRGYKPIPLH